MSTKNTLDTMIKFWFLGKNMIQDSSLDNQLEFVLDFFSRAKKSESSNGKNNSSFMFLFLLFFLTFLGYQNAYSQFTSGRLLLNQVTQGGGSALTNSGANINLLEYKINGTAGTTLALPTTTTSSVNRIVQSGTATTEGHLTTSVDGRYILIPGYDGDTSTSNVSTTSGVNRVLARIDVSTAVNTMVFSSASAAGTYWKNNFRAITSVDGKSFWLGGAAGTSVNGSDGVRYVVYDGTYATSANPTNSATLTSTAGSNQYNNIRSIRIFNNKIYYSTQSGTIGIYSVGNGTSLPISTTTPIGEITSSTTNPQGFMLFSAGGNNIVMYVIDGINTSTYGIYKYYYNGTTWSAQGSVLIGGSTSLYGLTGYVDSTTTPAKVNLYATTPNNVYSLADTAGFAATMNGTFTSIATAATNTAFRGVCFTPTSIVTQPADLYTCSNTNAVFSIRMNACDAASNYKYNWQSNTASDFSGTTIDLGTGSVSGTNNVKSTYTVSSVTSSTPRYYRCVITYMGQHVLTSNIVTLTVDKKWTGITSTDWNDATNWTPSGVPTSSDCIVIPSGTTNSPIISGNAFANNLTINSSASLQVNSGIALEVQDFVKTDGTLTMNTTSSLVQINSIANSGSGSMIYKRNVTGLNGYDYVYWSSPVNSSGANGQLLNSIYASPVQGYKYKWDPTATNTNGTQGNWISASGDYMIPGKGYIVRTSSLYGLTNQTINAAFTGVPNNGTISLPIYRGSLSGLNDNYNLLGNPYPSSISIIKFLQNNTSINGNVSLWKHSNAPTSSVSPFYQNFLYNYYNDYITVNGTGASNSSTTPYYIGAGQGFYVSMSEDPVTDYASLTGSITFLNSMRDKTYDNSIFYKSSSEKNRIWLDLLDSNNNPTRTLIGYVDNATNDADRMYDAETTMGTANKIYSVINNKPYIIQGKSLPFDTNDQVPLGITIASSGAYKIAINEVDGLFEQGQSIFLEDKLLNTIYDLRQAPYAFTSASGTFNDRFVLRYTSPSLANTNFSDSSSSFVIYNSEGLVNIKSDKVQISGVEVYDIQGRLLYDFKNINTSEFQFPATIEQQVLVLKIITTDNLSFYRKFSK